MRNIFTVVFYVHLHVVMEWLMRYRTLMVIQEGFYVCSKGAFSDSSLMHSVGGNSQFSSAARFHQIDAGLQSTFRPIWLSLRSQTLMKMDWMRSLFMWQVRMCFSRCDRVLLMRLHQQLCMYCIYRHGVQILADGSAIRSSRRSDPLLARYLFSKVFLCLQKSNKFL